MKKIIVFLIASMCISFQLSAAVDREARGTVQIFAVAGNIIVNLSGTGSAHSCGSRYFFKPDSDYNRALLSMLLAAQMANKEVWINGDYQCKTEHPYNGAFKLVNMEINN